MNCKIETRKIVKWIRKTFKEARFKNAVLGISGGIDSAVICALLVKTLGAKNVYTYSLPYEEQFDIQDAKDVAIKYKVDYETIEIQGAVNTISTGMGIKNSDIRLGNIKARIRMIVLYDQSNLLDALVVGTGNKTELMLGYFTHYGDGACAMEPIGHLYKTEVKELAKYLKVPQRIIDKAPSAGLWEGQTDEEELGASYKEIDNCLIHIESYGKHPSYSFPKNGLYDKLLKRIEKNKFKSQLPKQMGE